VTPTRIATRMAHAVVLAYGWRRGGIAFFAGAASALALPPFNAWPVLFLTFPVLVWLVDGSAAGRWRGFWTAAGAGWCFGFGYFLAGLYWVGYAFLVDAKTFGWLLPFAVGGLPAYLALYTGLGLAVARLLWVRGPRGCWRSPSPSPRRNGCAAICSAAFPGTPSVTRSPSRWRWRKASRWSASGG
jgi:apolipoprotein N-acyltransferase